MKKPVKSLGEVLRDRRKEKKVSLRVLGDCVDLSAAYLCDIEHGNRVPSESTLKKIAYALDLDVVQVAAPCPKCHGGGTVQATGVQV